MSPNTAAGHDTSPTGAGAASSTGAPSTVGLGDGEALSNAVGCADASVVGVLSLALGVAGASVTTSGVPDATSSVLTGNDRLSSDGTPDDDAPSDATADGGDVESAGDALADGDADGDIVDESGDGADSSGTSSGATAMHNEEMPAGSADSAAAAGFAVSKGDARTATAATAAVAQRHSRDPMTNPLA